MWPFLCPRLQAFPQLGQVLLPFCRVAALASLGPEQAAYLREQLALAMHGLFAFGAVAMSLATVLSLRLEERRPNR